MSSPGLTDCLEQYPSIQGQRYPSLLSSLTRVSCQSRAPVLLFSVEIRSGDRASAAVLDPAAAAAAEMPKVCRTWRRVGLSMGQILARAPLLDKME